MKIAKVVGVTICTVKEQRLENSKMMIVCNTDQTGEVVGEPYIAQDIVGVGSEELVTWCKNKTRSYLLSGSHPPATAASSIKALDIIEHEEPDIVKRLWDNINYFKKGIIDMGYNHEITEASTTAIIPIIFGDPLKAKEASNLLYSDYGIFALPIVFPMVPRGLDRIRVQANAALSKEELDTGLRAFEELGNKLKIF